MDRERSSTKPTMEEDTTNLPFEVIYTILSKLPVKSLLRFRCVCKPWRALISEPRFIELHLYEAIRSDRQRVICSVIESECFFSVDCETLDFETPRKSEEELYFPIPRYREASFLCSCYGVVLLGFNNDKMYVLWNPSTRKYKRFSCPHSGYFLNPFYGICYDSSVDDYKVLIISLRMNNNASFMVYTCKTNSWAETRDFPYLAPRCGVTVGGVLHLVVALKKCHNWIHLVKTKHGGRGGHNTDSLTTLTDDPSKACETSSPRNINQYEAVPSYFQDPDHTTYAVVYFDSVEEKFKEVPLPNWICGAEIYHLIVRRERLCLILTTSEWQQHDFWEMKEYGNGNSWTKLMTIPLDVAFTNYNGLKPVWFTKRGEVVLIGEFVIVLYDPKENKMRNKASSITLGDTSTVVSCVDSLVSV